MLRFKHYDECVMKTECSTCGHVGEPKIKGSIIITIILLFFGLLPGIFYEIWRRSGGKVCSNCGSNHIHLYRPPVNRQLTQAPVMEQIAQQQCPDCMEFIRSDARKCKHCGNTNLN